EGGSVPLPKPPPDAVRAGGRRGAGALPSEASNLRTAPAKPALEAEHSCSRGYGNQSDRLLAGGTADPPVPRLDESLLDLAQTQDLGPAIHVLAHLAAERLEMLARAVRLHGRLVGIALHEDIGARRL